MLTGALSSGAGLFGPGVIVCGVDEAGRGPLAGPVVAAAVILPGNFDASGIADSKKLTESQRETCYERIVNECVCFGVGSASSRVIDEINILQATFRAMRQAISRLREKPQAVLVDGNLSIPRLKLVQKTIIGGDGTILPIACASIIAKVTRDRVMDNYHRQYPDYGFDHHKGYPTEQHRQRIAQFGPLPIHRKSFRLLDPQCALDLEAAAESS
jgi:ribonuclease HII